MDEDKCQQCGTPAAPDAKFCESCGANLIAERASQAPPQEASQEEPLAVPAATAAATAPAPTFQAPYAVASPYQGVPIRFVAVLIDAIIIAIIAGILAIPLQTRLSGAVSLLIFLLYYILLEGAYGQTVGKMAVNIKVVREDGTKIDYTDAVVRTILRIIDAIPFVVPYLLGAILIWTSDKKQRLGDRTAHTVVVKA
jgi:uncharacterized RDD family membrane protein YckC